MARLRKALMTAGTTGVVGLAALAGTSMVSAQSSTSSGTTTNTSPMSSLVQKIADKFNLNKDDVQKVFDEDRASHEAEMTAKVESELSQAVTDGKLTETQKSAILAKRTELQQARETHKDNFESMTEEQRRSAMETKRAELQTWATQNNIPTEYLRYVMGGGRGRGGPGEPAPSGSTDGSSSSATN